MPATSDLLVSFRGTLRANTHSTRISPSRCEASNGLWGGEARVDSSGPRQCEPSSNQRGARIVSTALALVRRPPTNASALKSVRCSNRLGPPRDVSRRSNQLGRLRINATPPQLQRVNHVQLSLRTEMIALASNSTHQYVHPLRPKRSQGVSPTVDR